MLTMSPTWTPKVPNGPTLLNKAEQAVIYIPLGVEVRVMTAAKALEKQILPLRDDCGKTAASVLP